jgi:hypothetical protein
LKSSAISSSILSVSVRISVRFTVCCGFLLLSVLFVSSIAYFFCTNTLPKHFFSLTYGKY